MLSLLELSHEQLIPLIPGFDVSLEQGLGLVVASVVFVAAALVGRSLRAVFQEAERGLVFRQVFSPRHRVDERGDRDPRERFVESPQARVRDLPGRRRHLSIKEMALSID